MSFTKLSAYTRLPYILLTIFIALHAAVTLVFSLTLRNELKTSGLDGTLFEQLLYNVIHGNGFITTIPGISQNWLGIHFSPILYALVPVYYIFPHMETLLVVHSTCIALAAWPIFLVADHMLRSRWQALLAASLYLINPFVINAAIWDFHEIAFAPLLIAFMLWAIVRKKPAQLVIFSILLLATKGHYGLTVFGSGLLWAWHWQDWRFGISLAVFGLAALAIIVLLVMPHFNIDNTLSWADSGQTTTVNRFSWLRNPFGSHSPISSIILDGFNYVFSLVALLWFVPLAAPIWWLPGLADIAANILSENLMMRSVYSYHSAALQPVLVIASIICIATFFEKRKISSSKSTLKSSDILAAMMITSLFASYVLLVQTGVWEFKTPQITLSLPDRNALNAIDHIIPENASIAGQPNALPHVSMRRNLYVFPLNIGDADYIVLHAEYPFHDAMDHFDTIYALSPKEYFEAVNTLFQDSHWHVLLYDNKWIVLGKTTPENAIARAQAVRAFAAVKSRYDDLLHASKLQNAP